MFLPSFDNGWCIKSVTWPNYWKKYWDPVWLWDFWKMFLPLIMSSTLHWCYKFIKSCLFVGHRKILKLIQFVRLTSKMLFKNLWNISRLMFISFVTFLSETLGIRLILFTVTLRRATTVDDPTQGLCVFPWTPSQTKGNGLAHCPGKGSRDLHSESFMQNLPSCLCWFLSSQQQL